MSICRLIVNQDDPMLYFGCDTETYNDGDNLGLKSIQLVGRDSEYYFISSDYSKSDDYIRNEISYKFIRFLSECKDNVKVGFFNLTFDLSQFLKFLITESGYSLIHEYKGRLKKGELSILETDRKVFSVKMRSFLSGYMIEFIDISNFAVASTLNDVAKSWIGKQKVDIESKEFPKRQPTEKEKEYAMQDARLTYEIYVKFIEDSVIELKTYTIAGRTIKDFKNFIKKNYCTNFEKLMFNTDDPDEINEMKEMFENELRLGVKGGICQAFYKGVFENITHIDARSMYPTQMYRDWIPYGGLLKEKPISKHTEIVYPIGWYVLKKNHVPCVQWTSKSNAFRYAYKNIYECGQYVNDFYLDGSYPIWKEEYEIIKEQYDVYNEQILKRWYIKLRENIILKQYIEMLYDGKKNNTGSKRLFFKYLLNALYGKFLTRPDGVTIDYVYENEQWERIKVVSEKSTYYLPLGMWIAMMGRVTLMRAIMSIDSKDFLYCDTDSIIFKGDKMPNVTIGKNLGDWSIEQKGIDVNIVGAKTYQEKIGDEIITKCGGLPRIVKDKLGWLELKDGMSIKCSKPRRDKNTWAINIIDTEFTVSTKASIFRR